MEQSILFWGLSGLAVILTGISKGGFGGLTLLAVPLMAMVMPPTQAASIMLPILIVMDIFSFHAYRKYFNRDILWLMLPAALVGIAIGWVFTRTVSDDDVRIAVGLIAVSFSLYSGVRLLRGTENITPLWAQNKWVGRLAGLMSGLTSFFAHAGGPPFKIYVIPKKLESKIFVGTSVVFFAVVNAVKLIPYAMLGQLSASNLMASFYLIPLAPIGVWIGVWGVKKLPVQTFYKISYVLIFCVGMRLLYKGLF